MIETNRANVVDHDVAKTFTNLFSPRFQILRASNVPGRDSLQAFEHGGEILRGGEAEVVGGFRHGSPAPLEPATGLFDFPAQDELGGRHAHRLLEPGIEPRHRESRARREIGDAAGFLAVTGDIIKDRLERVAPGRHRGPLRAQDHLDQKILQAIGDPGRNERAHLSLVEKSNRVEILLDAGEIRENGADLF